VLLRERAYNADGSLRQAVTASSSPRDVELSRNGTLNLIEVDFLAIFVFDNVTGFDHNSIASL
jgi:hypothetical protein